MCGVLRSAGVLDYDSRRFIRNRYRRESAVAAEVKIPYLGYTMTEAKIVAWYKKEGDPRRQARFYWILKPRK